MKYLINYEDTNLKDCIIAYGKDHLKTVVSRLLSNCYDIVSVHRFVKGRFVSVDLKPLLKSY